MGKNYTRQNEYLILIIIYDENWTVRIIDQTETNYHQEYKI